MNLTVFCTNGLYALSLRERAGVRVRMGNHAWKTLTLTLSQGERGKRVPVKMNVTPY